MEKAAGRSRTPLGESTDLVLRFLAGRRHGDGGFVGRDGASDLYYTMFALAAQAALGGLEQRGEAAYLRDWGEGDGLDLVHLAALLRGRACVGLDDWDEAARGRVAAKLAGFRRGDGGYAVSEAEREGTAYGCFLAVGAHQDMGEALPSAPGVVACLAGLATPGGGYVNEGQAVSGGNQLRQGATTTATAAAVTVLCALGENTERTTGEWLMERYDETGGFYASAATPVPDLLSTATGLHALAAMGRDVGAIRERCLDFVDTLWSGTGGFHGHWADNVLDCEYTFYGLLALGHLAGRSVAQ